VNFERWSVCIQAANIKLFKTVSIQEQLACAMVSQIGGYIFCNTLEEKVLSSVTAQVSGIGQLASVLQLESCWEGLAESWNHLFQADKDL
jgi:hypothetical protein